MSDYAKDQMVGTLTNQLRERRISRRRFMEDCIATGLTVAAATGIASKVEAGSPKPGGHFRVGQDDGNTTDTLDPALYLGQFEISTSHTHRNYLTEITPDNVVGPELAESYEASPDATVWHLKLRKGVEFHDGKSFTSQDVVDSLNYHRGENSQSGAKSLLDSVEDIKADDDHSVTVTLNAGSADFPYVLTDYHFTMLPSDGEGGVNWDAGSGTGGYVLTDWEPGVRAAFERFPNYWKEGRAHFDSVEMFAIPDVNARQSAIQTGDVDAIIEVDVRTAHLMAEHPDINVIEVPSGTHLTYAMHVDVPPFDSNDVRLALKYALDREMALNTVLNGHGTIGNDHPIGPTIPYHSAELEQRVYDPDKAKFHLKQAGMEGLKVDLSASDVPMAGGVDLSVLYQETAKAAGMEVNVVREPEDGYWSDVWLVKPFSLVSWGARPTPDIMFSLGYAADAPWNDTHFQHERFNQILIEARAELDDAKRAEMYHEMQQIMRDEGGAVVPMFRNFVYAARTNVMHDDELSGNWSLDGSRGAERWWFA